MTSRRLRVLPMRPRDIDEQHRASTPLELLFDLSFVVAVSQAADQLNAALGAGHFHTAIVSYLLVFFAIWWAWVNFTWFASAYDVDDLLYRLLTFVQIIGVLILAAGVDSAFTAGNFTVMTIGYVVMRIAMVAQWLRAAAGDPAARPAALRYAACISILQVGWVVRLFLPQPAALWVFYVLGIGEMLVPSYAERAARGGTPWHPGHIAERYGLFTLIVLGECIAAVTVALHSASLGHTYTASLGAGAFLDGAPVAPSAKTNLAVALVGTSHPPFVAAQPEAVAATGRAVPLLLPAVGAHRNLGPTSWQVADVASGRLDAFWQYGRDPGNLLAASLVATEAGVVVTDMDGEPWRADSAGFLAAPARLHEQLLELFAKARS